MNRQRFLAVARGDEPADLVLTGGRLLNVFTGEVLEQAVSVAEGRVAAVGEPRRVAEGTTVRALVPLPLGGLISDRPLHEVRGRVDRLLAASRELGTGHPDPFMALSFLALEVIPSLKLTDRGLVDVVSFRQVPLFVGDG